MRVFITGGAGFIGVNAAARYALRGDDVILYDNLSRKGSDKNLEWILTNFPQITFIKGDVRDVALLSELFRQNKYDAVLHLAAQVAVTTSVENPVEDNAINVGGTLAVLEALRHGKNPQAPFIYSSTNKVYGELEHFKVGEEENRYTFIDLPTGVHEEIGLDFHSPYGCSKGAADQYVRDYARIYGLNTVVFRQSCIYGQRQMGIEDQGWVAWIMSRAALGLPARIYGTGKQVRDLLYVGDLLDAYDASIQNISKARGHVYAMGGGPGSAMSVIELMYWLKKRYPNFTWEHYDWRPGDQKVYISDISKAKKHLDWSPKTSVEEGLDDLMSWIEEHKHFFADQQYPIISPALAEAH